MNARKKKKTVARSLALALIATGILPLNGCQGGGGGIGQFLGGAMKTVGSVAAGAGKFALGALGTVGNAAGSLLGGAGNVAGSILGGGPASGSAGITGPSAPSFQGQTGGALSSVTSAIGKPYAAPPSGGIGVTPGVGN